MKLRVVMAVGLVAWGVTSACKVKECNQDNLEACPSRQCTSDGYCVPVTSGSSSSGFDTRNLDQLAVAENLRTFTTSRYDQRFHLGGNPFQRQAGALLQQLRLVVVHGHIVGNVDKLQQIT